MIMVPSGVLSFYSPANLSRNPEYKGEAGP